MVSTDYANNTSFNFESLEEYGDLWDQTFDVSPIEGGSFTTESSSMDEAPVNTTDPAALISTIDAMVGIDLPPLGNFDFTRGDVSTTNLIFGSPKAQASYGESTHCPILHGQDPNAKPHSSVYSNFCSTAGCRPGVEKCPTIPYMAPITPSIRTSAHRSKAASLDLSLCSFQGSAPPNAKKKKLSIDIEGRFDENQGKRRSKTAHSVVERKYRENLNSKISQLQQTLLVTDFFSQEDSWLSGEAAALNVAKPRKGDILTNTIDYIQRAEIDKRHMSEEIKVLKLQIAAMQSHNRCADCSLVSQLRALQLQVPVKI